MVTIPMIAMLVGLLLYRFGPNLNLHAHTIEIMRLLYFCGLFITLYVLANKIVF